ncbi:MAG TPA: hypothetical protein VK906_12420 [Egicoccus sp.]|nr:hypothetical protein [Egicoccus sp.]HSK23979.1 hypothetical protein [Egicoccus sp.]
MTSALHLHTVRHVDRPIDEVVTRLRQDIHALADAATASALDATSDVRAGFALDVTPRVDARVHDDGMAVVSVTWNDDSGRWPPAGPFPFAIDPTSPWWHREEEHTGWPTMTLQVVVTPTVRGSRLAVLSTRTPGVDVSTNRIDRHRRDRLARAAVEQFLDALAELLAPVAEPAVAV